MNHPPGSPSIKNMTLAALDIEELERRLELVTQVACCDFCGGRVCDQHECFVDGSEAATPRHDP